MLFLERCGPSTIRTSARITFIVSRFIVVRFLVIRPKRLCFPKAAIRALVFPRNDPQISRFEVVVATSQLVAGALWAAADDDNVSAHCLGQLLPGMKT